MIVLKACWRSSKEVPMAIIGGLDVHRSQITYDWIDTQSGQHQRGQLAPAHREHLRGWLEQFQGRSAAFALEGCTGWRYVVEELQRAGVQPHLAEPADTSTLRGPKRRAKTDRTDAAHLRELLAAGRLPESWIPPAHVLEARTRVRCYKALLEERAACWPPISACAWSKAVACHQPPTSRSPWRCAWSTTWMPSWRCCGPSWSALPAARWAAGRWMGCMASARWPRWRSGPSLARSRASPPPGLWCATPAWTSPSTPPTANAPPAGLPARAHRYCAGRCLRRPSAPPAPPPPTTPTTRRSSSAWAATAPP